MKLPVVLSLAVLFSLFAGCNSIQVVEQKDSLGRLKRVASYQHSNLINERTIFYDQNSFNPVIIRYRKKQGGFVRIYRQENFTYEKNNLVKQSFFAYSKGKMVLTGFMTYDYVSQGPSRISYFRLESSSGTYYLRCLDQYNYKNDRVASRRLIEYESLSETGKTMQVGQYVIRYDEKGHPRQFRSYTLDKKTKKIIEKKVTGRDDVMKLVEKLEKRFQNYLKVISDR